MLILVYRLMLLTHVCGGHSGMPCCYNKAQGGCKMGQRGVRLRQRLVRCMLQKTVVAVWLAVVVIVSTAPAQDVVRRLPLLAEEEPVAISNVQVTCEVTAAQNDEGARSHQ